MTHHRRKRPRKQPSSVMSSPDRIFKGARDRDVEEPECAPQPRPKRKKLWVIQRRYIRANSAMASLTPHLYQQLKDWQNFRRYYTEGSRDKAFDKMVAKDGKLWEFRKIDPN